MCAQNIIKLSAAVHELSGAQTFFTYLAMVKKSENPFQFCDLNLEILWVSRGCQGTYSCKIPFSQPPRFVSYRANREINSEDNNNTDSNNMLHLVHAARVAGFWVYLQTQIKT